MKVKIEIEDMMCQHCVDTIKNSLEALDEVENVKINLKKKTASVKLNTQTDTNILIKTIKNQGYAAKTI